MAAPPENRRALYLKLLRDFLDNTPDGMVVTAEAQHGTRKTGNSAQVGALDVAAHEATDSCALVFVTHHAGDECKIPRVVRDG